MMLLQVPTPPPVPNPADTQNFIQQAVDLLASRQWQPLVALLIIGFVALSAWAAPKLSDRFAAWMNTPRGRSIFVLASGVVGAIGASLWATKLTSQNAVSVIVKGAMAGFTAAGGYSIVKNIFSGKKEEPMKIITNDIAKPIDPPPPIRPGALLPIIFATFFIAGCACAKPENRYNPGCQALSILVNCGTSALIGGLTDLVAQVTPGISGGDVDWEVIGKLEQKHGTDAVMCALQQALQIATGRSLAGMEKPEMANTVSNLVGARNNVQKNVSDVFAARKIVFVKG